MRPTPRLSGHSAPKTWQRICPASHRISNTRSSTARLLGDGNWPEMSCVNFRSVRAVDSSYRRESLEVSGERAVEVVVQDAVAEVGAFLGIVRREWRVRRRGRYLWTDTGDGWQIAHVHVLEETVTGSRVWFRLPW